MHSPTDRDLHLVKRILCYIKGTLNHGFLLSRSASSDLVIYSDVDWAGCPNTRCFTSGYCAYFRCNLVLWSSKWQNIVSRSSVEAEYRGVANTVAKSCWLHQLLTELGHPPQRSTIVFCDNVSASYQSSNPVHHHRTKHIGIDIHFVRDKVSLGEVKVMHVPSSTVCGHIHQSLTLHSI
jgi:hypothetical protein